MVVALNPILMTNVDMEGQKQSTNMQSDLQCNLCKISQGPVAQQEHTGLKLVGLINFFPRIDDSHFNWIHSSYATDHYLRNGIVGQQPVAWKEYSVEYW